jgi:mannan endo-1,4-beta-mannosidase
LARLVRLRCVVPGALAALLSACSQEAGHAAGSPPPAPDAGCVTPVGCGDSCACGPPVPADPDAVPAATSVLTYLAGLPNRTDKRVVSGQKYRYDWDWTPISQNTGRTPALMGGAYVCWKSCGGKPFNKVPLSVLIQHWQSGGLVQMTEMIGNPKTGGGVVDTNFTPDDFDHLLTAGDPVNQAYLSQLDIIAAGYQELASAGVVVLVHALQEMNGYWCWWSQGTPEQYKALWRMEFQYLTQTKGLHNLLFTYAPNAGSGCYAEYYPGDAYIDVVGVDYYLNVDGPIPKAGGYDELTTAIAPCKPFGFIEFGPIQGGDLNFTPRDYQQLIVAIKTSMPKVTYWHSWNQVWGMGIAGYPATKNNTHLNVPELLSDPWVVNLGDVTLP